MAGAALASGKGALHMVNAWVEEHGLCLGEVSREGRGHELGQIAEPLKLLEIKKDIVTIDAIACNPEITRQICEESKACTRLMEIPETGFLTAIILLSVVGDSSNFKSGREFAAYLGLVPGKIALTEKSGSLAFPNAEIATLGWPI